MSRASSTLIRGLTATILGGMALFWSGELPLNAEISLVSSAEARIGRPFTPLSYAGVARRTSRRAVAFGAAAGAAYAAPMVMAPAMAPRCGQAVDAYGRIVTVCR
jgi:hypothetical protein